MVRGLFGWFSPKGVQCRLDTACQGPAEFFLVHRLGARWIGQVTAFDQHGRHIRAFQDEKRRTLDTHICRVKAAFNFPGDQFGQRLAVCLMAFLDLGPLVFAGCGAIRIVVRAFVIKYFKSVGLVAKAAPCVQANKDVGVAVICVRCPAGAIQLVIIRSCKKDFILRCEFGFEMSRNSQGDIFFQNI